MKLAIMQPYFFPYLGYIALIKHTDAFILFDPVQFIRHGWIERNRVLKQDGGWQYIAVPLKKHDLSTKIKDIEINNSENWRGKILAQLAWYKKKAPFYKQAVDVIEKGVSVETNSITELNRNCLQAVCDYLSIPFNSAVFSDMDLTIKQPEAPDEWALNICTALGGVDEYWNPPGGIEFFDKKKYENAGITLRFLKPSLPFYSQRRGAENFENGLSVIDVMMFNSPETINKMLDDYELL